MVRIESALGFTSLIGLFVGMLIIGTGNPSQVYLYASGAAFAIAILALVALTFLGGED